MAEELPQAESAPEPEAPNKGPGRGNWGKRPGQKPPAHGATQAKAHSFLRDMIYVYRNEKPARGKKESQGRTMLRKMLEENPAKFIAMFRAEQKEFRREKEAKRDLVKGLAGDEGTERVLALCEQLLIDGKEKGEW